MASQKNALGLQTWVPLVTGLVGVLIGGAISILTVERQIQVSQEAEQRQLRAETYLALIDAADDYANRTDEVLDTHKLRGPITAEEMDLLKFEPHVSPWLDSRNTFQDALNRVSIYGSADGWEAALDLAGTLPYSQGDNYEWVEVSPEMGDRYRSLLGLVCAEATVTPRDDCTQDRDAG
ncbi:hypothetical protein [Microbacterium sp. NPDC090003]|uniref:hypothetical protein n=1 Tax=Microbacterium sp. NPDC090003 TaxID=3364203 RepID=UPI0038208C83